MMCNRVGHLLLGIALSGVPLLARADDLPPPLEPAAGLASLHVPAGYRVEQVAAEPLVTSPVALDWGPDGRLWVAEMIDYPLGLDNQGQPGGRICYLEDTDGDGRYDRRASFLDGVAFPNGVMAWRDGVLVTAAGELFFGAIPMAMERPTNAKRFSTASSRAINSIASTVRVGGWTVGVIWPTATVVA